MERKFELELEELAATIQRMGGLVEQAIERSVEALVRRDDDLARQVITEDLRIDALELEADKLAMQILARYQLAGRDLRFVTTAMKILPELERMADQAVNTAERAIELGAEPPVKPLIDLPKMAHRAREMVRGSLDAFVRRDAEQAREVIALDDELDHRTEAIFRELVSYMMEDPATITRSIRLTFVAKYFERIGDQATNVAEQVIYMVEGTVVRHPRLSKEGS
ncbi:MAG: phosphate signaling complex protein PhoU [Acidobacteriota bacterium]|nr:phosphate signaling complex protein PhoU [Acidobacteriota bacterium]MDQ7087879.1 phosphate signaling complex protein PhoU [Acidobacteriota bacterium]